MKIAFISNYFNHHQLPFCSELYNALGYDFRFIQTMKVEKERADMGWNADESTFPPYVVFSYQDKEKADRLVLDADVALIGWADCEDLVEKRMEKNLPTVRVSERIYREGRWKFITPRGLVHKFREHIRYRDKNLFLLAIGAHTPGDFRLIQAYPDKIFRWGYFPVTERFIGEGQINSLFERKSWNEPPMIVWAGRFMALKHPEFAVYAAVRLNEAGRDFRMKIIGDGEGAENLKQTIREHGLQDKVTFTGFLSPRDTREAMLAGNIFLFTSNHLEGWGAVVSEAMGAGMAVIAGSESGAPPSLIKQGQNGFVYHGCEKQEMLGYLKLLVDDQELTEKIGREALHTASGLWSPQNAAARFLEFCECICRGERFDAPNEGPMSRA